MQGYEIMKTRIQSGQNIFRKTPVHIPAAAAAFAVLLLISCSQLFNTVSSGSTGSTCTLTVSLSAPEGCAPEGILAVASNNTAQRTVFPSFNGSWKAKIWKKDSTEPSSWSTSGSSRSTGSLTFAVGSVAAATYNVRMGFFTTDATAAAFYTTTPAAVTVTEGQTTAACTVSVLPADCTAAGGTTTGSISLGLKKSSTSINSLSVSLSDSSGNAITSSNFLYASSIITGTSLPQGTYTLSITGLDSSSAIIYRYPDETLYVWPGMTTNTWHLSGGNTETTLDVTEAMYTAARTTTFCVSAAGSDTDDRGGGFASPFLTVQHAVSRCIDTEVNGSGGTGYTIYIDGTITLSSTISMDGSKKITFSGLNGSTTDIIDGNSTCQILNIASGSTVTIENLTLQNGYADSGGGVYNAGTFNMKSGIIKKNTAHNYGGGVFNSGTFNFSGGSISENKGTDNAGGIDNSTGTVNISGGTISGNTSGSTGGGINNYSKGTITMTAGTISGNTAATSGGGINLESGSFTMSGGTISGNKATSGKGGGVNIQAGEDVAASNTATFTMSGGTVTGNSAPSGGGVNVCSEGTFTMSGSGTITGNSATTAGSGVFVDGTFEISGSAVVDAETTGANDVYLPSGKYITVGTLSGTGIVAEITPAVTDTGTKILTSSSDLDSSTVARFYLNTDDKSLTVDSTDKTTAVIASGYSADTVSSVISKLSSGTHTIAVTGALTSNTIIAIKTALKSSSSVKVNLDLSGTTELISLDDDAFYECSSLTSVTLPTSVTSIGKAAFYCCSSLTSVTIPDSVTSIEGYAFVGCTSLTSVTIPASVTSIGEHEFYECSSLPSVTIPALVTSIGKFAFYGCSSLTSVTFSDTDTSPWYYTSLSDLTGGTEVDVSDVSNNATYLTSTYVRFYWYKN
jgi:hypothetical protein